MPADTENVRLLGKTGSDLRMVKNDEIDPYETCRRRPSGVHVTPPKLLAAQEPVSLLSRPCRVFTHQPLFIRAPIPVLPGPAIPANITESHQRSGLPDGPIWEEIA